MADYDQPNYVTRRLRYFNNQYLSEQDFIDEQKYHLDRQRRHDRLLHVSGIADGLDVTAKGAVVTVTAGTAVDAQGRHLLLDTPQTLTLTREHQGSRVVYVRYQAVPSNQVVGDQGVTGYTRFTETAQLLQEAPGGDASDGRLVLAELTVAADGTVTAVKTEQRRYSGLRLAGPTGKTLTLRASNDGTRAVLDTGLSLAEPLAVGTVNAAQAQLEVKAGAGRTPLRVTDVDGKVLLTVGNDSSLALGASDRAGKLSLGATKAVIELGAGVAGKHADAGKLGYQLLSSDALDIVGAGTSNTNRKVTVYAESGTTFTGELRVPDKMLWLRSGSDANTGLGWYGGNTLFSARSLDGPFLFGRTGGALGTNQGGQKLALSWNDQGSVSVTSHLEVGAGVTGKHADAGKIGYQMLSSDALDIVGAGTSNTNRKLTLYAEGGITLQGPLLLNDKLIQLRNSADGNHGLGWFGGSTTFSGFAPDGPVLYGFSGGGLGTRSVSDNRGRVALSWSSDGSVRIHYNAYNITTIAPTLVVPGLPERVRIIRGSVHGNGNINVGTGFRISKVSAGLYDITFDLAFNTPPTVVVTQQYTGNDEKGGDTLDNAVVVFNKQGSVRVKTGNNDGNPEDRYFHFIAIGT